MVRIDQDGNKALDLNDAYEDADCLYEHIDEIIWWRNEALGYDPRRARLHAMNIAENRARERFWWNLAANNDPRLRLDYLGPW